MVLPPFAELAASEQPPMDLLALALAAEFQPVDAEGALVTLDALAAEVDPPPGAGPEDAVDAVVEILGRRHRFEGDREEYDRPENSMLDVVLERRRGLPILLSVVYVAVAGRAGIPLAGVGLPGHFVVAHVGADPPIVLDPFGRGERIRPPHAVNPWSAHATALRMLNNLVRAYERRGDLMQAIRAAELRLELPLHGAERERLADAVLGLRARLN